MRPEAPRGKILLSNPSVLAGQPNVRRSGRLMQPHSPRIAVIDDDADVLESTRFLLEISGHVVQTFASACDFLAELRLQAFDCLILDHHMPALTGLELARRLRASGVTLPIM